ncbi:hypothetical protein HYH02_013799 [Chlamydomonas schloesseri]|uniref:Sulfotransferase n=1 Tax=Chlamydomonas schloesseri TaxID=2026947 RepID=A0A835SS02_9CHLO|nr:hypothetical protein HYH02_013799 [Chlamydomonas schloesseri]|eukprot:KAG2430322.1 hypothetical protein HYH02_013799 [Chlamydomonas schloesseri]
MPGALNNGSTAEKPAVRAGPDFALVGAQRAGTSSLYQLIMKNTYFAPVTFRHKETYYFSGTGSRWDADNWCDHEVEPYLQMTAAARRLRNTTNLLVGDFSPTHLHCICCAASFRMINPHMKVLALLRDPVSRAISRFTELKRPHTERWSAHIELKNYTFVSYVEAELPPLRTCVATARRFQGRAVGPPGGVGVAPRGWGAGWDMGQWMEAQCYARNNVLGWSVYAPLLENYAAHFGWRQMKVLYTPDLLASPLATLRAVEDFLGAPRAKLPAAVTAAGDPLGGFFHTRECYHNTCLKKRHEVRPLTAAMGTDVAGGAITPEDAAAADDLVPGAATAAGAGAAGAVAAAAGGGGSSSSSSSSTPFGRAVAALRAFYAPHVQQLLDLADQGVIAQPPAAWRAAYGLAQRQPAG